MRLVPGRNAALRLAGMNCIEEMHGAILENSGTISVAVKSHAASQSDTPSLNQLRSACPQHPGRRGIPFGPGQELHAEHYRCPNTKRFKNARLISAVNPMQASQARL